MVRMGYDPNVVRRTAAIVATPTGDITTLIDAMMEPAVKSMLPSLTGSHVSIGPFGAIASSLARKTRVRACVRACLHACLLARLLTDFPAPSTARLHGQGWAPSSAGFLSPGMLSSMFFDISFES